MNRYAGTVGLILAMAVGAVSAKTLVGVASVIDGDTIEIRGEKIRLHGIDAPESGQRCHRSDGEWACGQQAALALARVCVLVGVYSLGSSKSQMDCGRCDKSPSTKGYSARACGCCGAICLLHHNGVCA